MEQNELKILLEKYYRAETSVIEERLIKEYFADKALMDDADQAYFSAISDYKSIETDTKTFTVTSEKKFFKLKSWRPLRQVAAIFLFISIFATTSNSYIQYEREKEEETQRHNAEKDLISISEALNKGYSEMNESIDNTVNLPIKK